MASKELNAGNSDGSKQAVQVHAAAIIQSVDGMVLSALAYYAWKRGLDECEPAEAPETMYN